ncbi:hypothetical protein EYC84_011926 [Monilinia fructicola]|uniref:Uncharacterized protein n=1 Tax=Monilinia fructicola TaxID=38448 RepID=A0A5M9J7R0_MONFR|nr:hypothetical protein EYC84_011926 [Monilinia fructicola]
MSIAGPGAVDGIVKECQDDLFVAFGNIIHAFSKMILSEVAISIIARQIISMSIINHSPMPIYQNSRTPTRKRSRVGINYTSSAPVPQVS